MRNSISHPKNDFEGIRSQNPTNLLCLSPKYNGGGRMEEVSFGLDFGIGFWVRVLVLRSSLFLVAVVTVCYEQEV